MGGGYSANFQVCVTCAYWTGARTLNGTRTQALYEYGTKGDCYARSTSAPRWRNRPANGSCKDCYEKWAQLKSTTSNNKNSSNRNSGRSNGSKGIIPRPVFVGLILLVALFQYVKANLTYVISVGSIVFICAITCFIIMKKAENPIRIIIITILVGVILSIGAISIVSNYKNDKTDIRVTQELIDNTTIFKGYKPFLGSFNKLDHNEFYWGKMIVFGKIQTYWGGYLIETDRITEKDKYKIQLPIRESDYTTSVFNSSKDRNCIFFLSFDENNKGIYQLDNIKLYSEINGVSNPKKYNVKVIDHWIMNNIDK